MSSIVFLLVALRGGAFTLPKTQFFVRTDSITPSAVKLGRMWMATTVDTAMERPSSTNSLTLKSINMQIKEMRSSLVKDERTAAMIESLRSRNLNAAEVQEDGVDMKLVKAAKTNIDASASDALPTIYDPKKLEEYFAARPGMVATRVGQVTSATAGLLAKLLGDVITGNLANVEVKRAAELRNTIVSLGPFFIKLGQALSIRPDILSPQAMVELQKLCDKVPSFDSALAMQTIEEELQRPVAEVFRTISPEPVAAASLGQVYRATLASTGAEVAVKVQRPGVLETVSLDLYLVRKVGLFLRNFPALTQRFDLVAILDEFAPNFYAELDYLQECANGIRIAKDMATLPQVLIPRCYPELTRRRVHTAQWIDGEKLSQSKADNVRELVNLGVITYLTQLLDTGFFHADPHPGNMLRSPDGKLVILDFGLMTQITENQKCGMIEAIAHLIHRDYDLIGQDFKNLDFIPEGVDTAPIIPALGRVFDAALAGGGAKSINFQELAADLAEITFKFPFRIPPYFALIIRAISVLEGIALVGDPNFAIVDEAYPFIAKKLLTDPSPRMQAALRYMVYGKKGVLEMERLVDLLQALEAYVLVQESGTGSGGTGSGGSGDGGEVGKKSDAPKNNALVRESLLFLFSDDGATLREMLLDEVSNAMDALSRDTLYTLLERLGLPLPRVPRLLRVVSPQLTPEDRRVVESATVLIRFLSGGGGSSGSGGSGGGSDSEGALDRVGRMASATLFNPADRRAALQKLDALSPMVREFGPNMQAFGQQIVERLARRAAMRTIDAVFER